MFLLFIVRSFLQWVNICEDVNKGEPIRALVDKVEACKNNGGAMRCSQKTLLIATGKGKVRAGIFSRKHLLTTGMEPSTALPLIYQAKRRHMRLVLLDPNARGDRLGMATFEQSMEHLFSMSGIVPAEGIYVLAHSAAGAQLVRFLHDKQVVRDGAEHVEGMSKSVCSTASGSQFVIEAIAFTDSTHNVQWTKQNPSLQSALTDSSTSLYLKSAHQYSDTHEFASQNAAGKTVEVDAYWKHRFGDVRTLWAGTPVHELMNWTGRHCIWEHFDNVAKNKPS
jgi:hypothetical protein